MFLVAAEELAELTEVELRSPASAKWADFPISTFSHHHDACCRLAIEWLGAMDFAQLNGGGMMSGPRWLREKFKWGPSPWPLHWCEAIERETLDCGAHAALAELLFKARGVNCFRAQLIQRYNEEAIEQWRCIWENDGASAHWLDESLIYHEANAILTGSGELKLWDGSASCWINPVQRGGYGSIASVRLLSDPCRDGGINFPWGENCINLNEWTEFPSPK